LIELVALLLRNGTIDETGRFSQDGSFSDRLIHNQNGEQAFLIDNGERQVSLTQKDVRELQLGKAAIRAGIQVLLSTLSLSEAQVERVLLAGAFGSHLSPAALCDNRAVAGSVSRPGREHRQRGRRRRKTLLEKLCSFLESESLAKGTEYLELMRSAAFSDFYIEAMSFPEFEQK
jgi:uncharacterized 2Fe-2S/4Fe-4S cluster protein (DUF4445 family)